MEKQFKTAVVYARYSSDNQTEQSIEGQLRVCEQYAKFNDILIVDTYIDRAMSGTTDNRPDFQRMLMDSDKKQWDYVLVYKFDRFSRDKYQTTMHKKNLRANDCFRAILSKQVLLLDQTMWSYPHNHRMSQVPCYNG